MEIHSAVVRAVGRVVVFESRAHLVSQYKVVYTSDYPAGMSDDRIQLFRTPAQLAEISSVGWEVGKVMHI
jgi:hypothetical protein